MKNQELFDRTITILVKAYQKETLKHSQCHACAVGNIIAANLNLKPVIDCPVFHWTNDTGSIKVAPRWTDVHSYGNIHNFEDETDGFKQLKATGYSIQETAGIELAFEGTNDPFSTIDYFDADGYKGLMRVVDYLIQIHSATPQEAQSAKELFVLADVG